MAAQKPATDLSLVSLRGGMNDTDPPVTLKDNECVVAQNVEFFHSMLGERRGGCEPVDLTSASLNDEFVVTHLSQWFPTNVVTVPEWWGIAATPGTSVSVARNLYTAWSTVSPNDAIDTGAPDIYQIRSQALGSLFFWAYHSAQNRLHVWNGTTWRRTGMAQPTFPTAANHGSGTFSGSRYYRVRYIEKVGSVIIRRSEPSLANGVNPSGSGDGLTVTKPVTISEGETHWELEASTDGFTFYLIATTVVGTTTYLDTTAFASGYASQGPVSEVIGTYLLQPSAKYLAVDGDRLLLAGHWTDVTLQSTVYWTPVTADPGVGNSERLPLQVNNTLTLGGSEGGPITGITSAVNGVWYAFKWSQIHQFTRTGDLQHAYSEITLTKAHGAIPGTIVEGLDEDGAACIYFLDPTHGPSRIGSRGIQTIKGLRTTWSYANLNAIIAGHGVYYHTKHQVHWWVAIAGATTPNIKLVLQVSELSSSGGSASGGWSYATGRIAQAYTSAILSEQLFLDGAQTFSNRPYIGLPSPDFIQRCDVGILDAGQTYIARIVTRPYMLTGILNKWGAMAGALLADAGGTSTINIRFIKDFEAEFGTIVPVDLTPQGSETVVLRVLDDLDLSNAASIQIEIADA